jgi:CRISPR-associated exonuclease Cas4
MEAAHRWQMLYYLYYLKSKGIEAKGEINYPLIRKIAMGRMPPPKKVNICKKCAYYEFCFGDEA